MSVPICGKSIRNDAFCGMCAYFRDGRCAKNAPKIGTNQIAIWPMVRKGDFCGEFKDVIK